MFPNASNWTTKWIAITLPDKNEYDMNIEKNRIGERIVALIYDWLFLLLAVARSSIIRRQFTFKYLPNTLTRLNHL